MKDLYRYELVVEDLEDGTFQAVLGGETSPLRAIGTTPLLACAELVKVLLEWGLPGGGADRFLGSPASDALRREVGAPPRDPSKHRPPS